MAPNNGVEIECMTHTAIMNENSPLTLVIMAAGLGSRFGGDKQLAALGPSGETMLELSALSAYKAGFTKLVLVIRPELENRLDSLLRERINPLVSPEFQVCYCYQELDDLPAGALSHLDHFDHRQKPWGTAHALWCARHKVKGLMAVINADDYYGDSAFELLAKGLLARPQEWMMVAYPLHLTLSEHGGVNRGVCRVDQGMLQEVVEWVDIRQQGQEVAGLCNGEPGNLNGSTPVSMTCWGFSAAIFAVLEDALEQFIVEHGHEQRTECYLPMVIQHHLDSAKLNRQTENEQATGLIRVETAQEPWFGVTYPQDVAWVKTKLDELEDNKNGVVA